MHVMAITLAAAWRMDRWVLCLGERRVMGISRYWQYSIEYINQSPGNVDDVT